MATINPLDDASILAAMTSLARRQRQDIYTVRADRRERRDLIMRDVGRIVISSRTPTLFGSLSEIETALDSAVRTAAYNDAQFLALTSALADLIENLIDAALTTSPDSDPRRCPICD